MDRLDAMRAFVTSIERGSLAAAARTLGYSPATMTRAIARLEDDLEMRLLHRSTRSLRLTDFGATYLTTCRDVLAALAAVEQGAASEQALPSGLLTVTAPLMFGHFHVRPQLDAFLDANPAVQARLLLLDRVVNLVEEGVDVAIRLGRLRDSALLATRLGEVRRVLCASPSYLARRGTPKAPVELREHSCIMERDGGETEIWRFASPATRRLLPIAVRPRLVVNSAATAVASAVAGHGITRVMSYQAADAVEAGTLVVLLAQHEPPRIPVHLVLPPGRAQSAKQRAFVAFVAPPLRHVLAETLRQITRRKPRRPPRFGDPGACGLAPASKIEIERAAEADLERGLIIPRNEQPLPGQLERSPREEEARAQSSTAERDADVDTLLDRRQLLLRRMAQPATLDFEVRIRERVAKDQRRDQVEGKDGPRSRPGRILRKRRIATELDARIDAVAVLEDSSEHDAASAAVAEVAVPALARHRRLASATERQLPPAR